MKLCDFPLLSSELAQFTCDDLGADWQIVRPYQYRHTAMTISSVRAIPSVSVKQLDIRIE